MTPGPWIAVLIVVVLWLAGQGFSAWARDTRPDFHVSAIAQALGLRVTQGSPSGHLAQGPELSLFAHLFGLQTGTLSWRMEGLIAGKPVAFDYVFRVWRLRFRAWTIWDRSFFQSTLAVGAVPSSLAFEAWTQSPNEYLHVPAPSRGWPLQAQGHLAQGPWFLAADRPKPGLEAWIVQVAQHCPAMHLVLEQGVLRFVFTPMSLVSMVHLLPWLQGMLVQCAQHLDDAPVSRTP